MPSKEEYERRKAKGLCASCGNKPRVDGSAYCIICRQEYSRTYYQKNRERIREQQREYCQKNYEKRQTYWRAHNQRRRQTVSYKVYMDTKNAEQRGLSWELSIDQVGMLYKQPCHYCGDIPNGKLNGIDRQDSSIGYIIENCVPCCPTCNYAKWQMAPDEFVWHCNKVAQFNKKGHTKDDRYNQLTIGK